MNKRYFWSGFSIGIMIFIVLSTIVFKSLVIQPDVSLKQIQVQDLKGENTSLTSYKGKPLVVNYWATWCAPCIKEFPAFSNANEELEAKVTFVMISDESTEKITKFSNSKPEIIPAKLI